MSYSQDLRGLQGVTTQKIGSCMLQGKNSGSWFSHLRKFWGSATALCKIFKLLTSAAWSRIVIRHSPYWVHVTPSCDWMTGQQLGFHFVPFVPFRFLVNFTSSMDPGYVCIYIYIHIYTYIYIYTYIHTLHYITSHHIT